MPEAVELLGLRTNSRALPRQSASEAIFTLQQHAEDAVSYLKQAVTSEPANSEAHTFLADAYEQVGNVPAAAAERAQADSLKRRSGPS